MITSKTNLLNICNAAGMEMMKNPKDYSEETKKLLWEIIKFCFDGKCDTKIMIDELPF